MVCGNTGNKLILQLFLQYSALLLILGGTFLTSGSLNLLMLLTCSCYKIAHIHSYFFKHKFKTFSGSSFSYVLIVLFYDIINSIYLGFEMLF